MRGSGARARPCAVGNGGQKSGREAAARGNTQKVTAKRSGTGSAGQGPPLHVEEDRTGSQANARSIDEVVPCAALAIELLRFPRVLGTVHRASQAPREGASFLAAYAAEGAEVGRRGGGELRRSERPAEASALRGSGR